MSDSEADYGFVSGGSSELKGPGNESGFKIRGWAIQLNEVMIRDSTVVDGAIRWEGSVSAIFRELGINPGYHTPILRLLNSVNCMRQVVKGSRMVKSVYIVMRDAKTIPEDEWPSISSIVKSPADRLTGPAGAATLLEQRVRGIEERLGGLDVVKALAELQEEITVLQTEIKRITNGS